MDHQDNHLVRGDAIQEVVEKMNKHLDQYEQLPDSLQHAAKVALKDKTDVFISRTSGGKLSKYAAKRRRRKLKGK